MSVLLFAVASNEVAKLTFQSLLLPMFLFSFVSQQEGIIGFSFALQEDAESFACTRHIRCAFFDTFPYFSILGTLSVLILAFRLYSVMVDIESLLSLLSSNPFKCALYASNLVLPAMPCVFLSRTSPHIRSYHDTYSFSLLPSSQGAQSDSETGPSHCATADQATQIR